MKCLKHGGENGGVECLKFGDENESMKCLKPGGENGGIYHSTVATFPPPESRQIYIYEDLCLVLSRHEIFVVI